MPLSRRQIEAHCRDRLHKGEPWESVRGFLVQQGTDSDVSTKIISGEIRALRKKALGLIGWGAFAVVLSVVLAVVTTVSTQGMFVVVLWGPALIGVILLFAGLPQLLRLPKIPPADSSKDEDA